VLCTLPRSGSWLLADLVEQSGLAGEPDEYFRPDRFEKWKARTDDEPYGRFIFQTVANTASPNGVFGVKFHWYQLEWFIGQLRTLELSEPDASPADLISQWVPGPRYVHLSRQDRVRQAISWYRATYSDLWFERFEEKPGARPRLYRPLPAPPVPDWGHVRFLEQALIEDDSRWQEFFETQGIDALDVGYERLVEAPQETIEQILRHVGVPTADTVPPIRMRLKKLADDETERLADAYLKVRDQVEPKPLDIRADRAKIEARPIGNRLINES
jgi:LPS sulfotransferase NodH